MLRMLMMRRHGSTFMKNQQLYQSICKSSSTKMTIPLISSLALPSALVLVFQGSQNLIRIYHLKDPRNVCCVIYPYTRLAATTQFFFSDYKPKKVKHYFEWKPPVLCVFCYKNKSIPKYIESDNI